MIKYIPLQSRFEAAHRRKLMRVLLVLLSLGLIAILCVTGFSKPIERPIDSARAEQARGMHRLEKSIRRGTIDPVSLSVDRSTLLSRVTVVRFIDGQGALAGTMRIAAAEHPSWIAFALHDNGRPEPIIDIDHVMTFLQTKGAVPLARPTSCAILSTWMDDQNVERAQTTCIAQSGYNVDREHLALVIAEALIAATPSIDVPVQAVDGTILRIDEQGTQPMVLLATGRSNFKGSADGRKFNVRRALSIKLNNVVVPAGATFSFNDVLGKAVTTQEGWKLALAIFGGSNLRYVPGGGICQASTTLYRAALRAGLPIVEQKNHSLYVSYYEANGVGQDATIYPGQKDLRFINDTGGPLLIQSSYDGDDAFVHLYGMDDRRRVTLAGPFFAGNKDPALKQMGKVVKSSEVVWLRNVASSAGDVKQEVFSARYNALPKGLSTKFHAAAEETR